MYTRVSVLSILTSSVEALALLLILQTSGHTKGLVQCSFLPGVPGVLETRLPLKSSFERLFVPKGTDTYTDHLSFRSGLPRRGVPRHLSYCVGSFSNTSNHHTPYRPLLFEDLGSG